MQQPSPFYKRHRFSGEIISHAVWLYYRFLLSYRDMEEVLVERGIAVSYETIRRWCRKFGPAFAARPHRALKLRPPLPPGQPVAPLKLLESVVRFDRLGGLLHEYSRCAA